MSTAENPDTEAAQPHPDTAMMARVRAALDRWTTHPGARAPTSSILGTGAIAVVESVIAARHNDIPAIFLPSAGYALCVAMHALGIGPGDDVLIPALDWPASYAAVRGAGARPIPVAIDTASLTIDPAACAAARTPRTRAVVASHLHGVCADIPAVRVAVPGLPVVEDCAAAIGSTLDGHRAGTMGDIAVLSLGPGKQIDAGEGGFLLTADPAIRRRALTASAHPLRANLFGLDADPAAIIVRPHPLAAILALHALEHWEPVTAAQAHRAAATALAADPALAILGHDARRTNAGLVVAALATGDRPAAVGTTSAIVLPGARDVRQLDEVVRRTRLYPVRPQPSVRQAATAVAPTRGRPAIRA